MDRAKRRRITMKLKSPNPLFEQWILEWLDKANEEGSKSRHTYRKAVMSLRKYPLPFKSGKDCKILNGFGDTLCKMLDKKLQEYERESEKNVSKENTSNSVRSLDLDVNKPQLECSSQVKGKIVRNASSEEVPTKKKAITKSSSNGSVASSQTESQEDHFIFDAESFDIILYIDTGEVTGGKPAADPLLVELDKLPSVCAYEVKHLNVGDYVWISRHKTTKKELVLPYVVERKRLDDFAHSIKDGRYHEQKFRLKRSGIQNVIYLIENYDQKHVGLPITTLHQAAINTAIQDGFYVKTTSNLRHTAKYLTNFSRVLFDKFKGKIQMSCPKENLEDIRVTDDLVPLMTFKQFNQSSIKNKPMRVSELFVKMLIQIKGMSVDKALAIIEAYPTPTLLQKAYTLHPGSEGEKLLAHMQFGKYKKTIGPVLSKTVYQLFTLESF